MGDKCGLIKVVGLEPDTSAVHKIIWNVLESAPKPNTRRSPSSTSSSPPSTATNTITAPNNNNNSSSSRAELYYERTGVENIFPARKARAARPTGLTEEAYEPPGILPRTWARKHRTMIPSVIVVFFDLEWGAEDWESRTAECAAVVSGLRGQINGRATKLVAVLLQTGTPQPAEGVTVEERAISLRGACGLTTKSSLFVLPVSDEASLAATVVRLESAFFELSVSHYEGEIGRVRGRIDELSQTTETMMLVRYLYKIAFFHDMAGQRKEALRQYQQTYDTLQKLNGVAARNYEVKTLAGEIMGSVCSLLFATQAPLDALSRFRSHLATYRKSPGKADRRFQHAAWLASQYRLFGGLFEAAVANGLGVIQTEHPGFYYQFAADHARQRRDLCVELCAGGGGVDSRDGDGDGKSHLGLAPAEALYVGQVAATVAADTSGADGGGSGQRRLLPPEEMTLEHLCALERQYDHENEIVGLLKCARAQFLKYSVRHDPVMQEGRQVGVTETLFMRMVNRLDRELGIILLSNNKCKEALPFLTPCLDKLRAESWTHLLTEALVDVERCAYGLANRELYLNTTLELAGMGVNGTMEQRSAAQTNFVAVAKGGTPVQAPTQAPAPAGDWTTAASPPPPPPPTEKQQEEKEESKANIVRIAMGPLASCIDCKVFLSSDVPGAVSLSVALRSSLPAPLTLQGPVTLTFDRSEYESERIVWANEGPTSPEGESSQQQQQKQNMIVLNPNTTTVLEGTITCSLRAEHVLRITSVSAALVDSSNLTLAWDIKKGPLVGNDGGSLRQKSGRTIEGQNRSAAAAGKQSSSAAASTLATKRWELLKGMPATRVKGCNQQVKFHVEHTPPALVGEKSYVVTLTVTSHEEADICDGKLRVELCKGGGGEGDAPPGCLSCSGHENSRVIELTVDRLESGGKRSFPVTVVLDEVCRGHLNCTLTYSLAGMTASTEADTKEISIPIQAIKPFDIQYEMRDAQHKLLDPAVDDFVRGEAFSLRAHIKPLAPWPIILTSTDVTAVASETEAETASSSPVVVLAAAASALFGNDDLTLAPGEEASDVRSVCIDCGTGGGVCGGGGTTANNKASLGRYGITWRRADGTLPCTTKFALPSIKLRSAALVLNRSVPPVGFVGQPMPLRCVLTNNTPFVQEIELFVKSGDYFVFSGMQRLKARLLPGERPMELCFNLFPIKTGHAPLPIIAARGVRLTEPVRALGDTHVFVKPSLQA